MTRTRPSSSTMRPAQNQPTTCGSSRCSAVEHARGERSPRRRPACTGTSACATIGPPSTSGVTKCTVQPWRSARRRARAGAYRCPDRRAAATDGCSACGRRSAATKSAPRMRMKPASTMRSGSPRSIASASAASNAARDANARWSTTAVAMPCARRTRVPRRRAVADHLRDRAVDRAGVDGVDQRGQVGAAAGDQDRDARERHGVSVRAATARPAPIITPPTPMSGFTRRPRAARRPDVRRCRRCRTPVSPAALSDAIARVDVARRDGEHHADAAIEDAMHLVVGDVAVLPAASRRSAAAASVR